MKNIFRYILLVLIVIIVTINQNYIVDILAEGLKPVIRITMVQKTNQEEPETILAPQEELEINGQAKENKEDELVLEGNPTEKQESQIPNQKTKKNKSKLAITRIQKMVTRMSSKEGIICLKNITIFYQEGISAYHCTLDGKGKLNDDGYDSPINAKNNEIINLPRPKLGKATMSVFRNQKLVDQEVIIDKINGCYAGYRVVEPIDGFSRVGDSGGAIWILVNNEKILLGVISKGDFKTPEEAEANSPSNTAWFVFCQGPQPSTQYTSSL